MKSTHESQNKSTRRLTASGDAEVSAYLEIAKEKSGQSPAKKTRSKPSTESILIIDFGSQYSHLIVRRIRDLNVYCEIVSHNISWAEVSKLNPRGIILSGGPASVYEKSAPLAPSWVYESNLPILGICYGMQVIAHQLGGKVDSSLEREYGHSILHKNDETSPIFYGLPSTIPVWMSHGDRIIDMPPGFSSIAYTDNSPIAAMSNNGIVGIQFHPEVVHTPEGKEILKNFLYRICGCRKLWTSKNFVTQSIELIKKQVGTGKVICALSGGVDSAVTAALVHKAIGDQLTCIFVNNGLLRREESTRIQQTFQQHLSMNMIYCDASNQFLDKLEGIIDPEQKRKIIGEEFIRLFEKEANKLGHVDHLAQGTLYPDVIESQSNDNKVSAKIKTHHNVGGLPSNMKLSLVEPLRDLFKDEVRKAGIEIGLPEEMVYRQPFPGPGLAIRIIGKVTKEKLEILRSADWIVMDEIKGAKLYRDLWQSFAVLTDTKTVGVMGDFRTYGYVIAVRAVVSDDAMTADWARLPYDVLSKISNRIVNEVPQVNRVVYDITSKPPGTIEWE